MSVLELHEIGEVIRKVRKEKGLRLEDLADENISPATISNIERGVPHVNMEKTRYLLTKLDLELERLPSLLVSEQQELNNLKFELFMVETMRDIGKPDEAIRKLDKLNLDDSHPYASVAQYLRGKYYVTKRNWRRAERALFNSIRLANQNSYGKQENMEAVSFSQLSLCSFYQNDLDQALKYANSGIEAFVNEGERKECIYTLLRNKSIYLERLGRTGEAIQIVQEVWDSIENMEQIENVLTFYWLRAELLRRSGMYEEAAEYAIDGLEKARLNQSYDLMLDLWTVLGSIHMSQKNWSDAQSCFDMAINLEEKINAQIRFATIYSRTGMLHLKLNNTEDAYRYINKAVHISRSHNDAPRLTYALQILGDYHRSQNQIEEALQCFKEVKNLAQKHHYKRKEHQALFRLSQCWENRDEKEFLLCLRNMYNIQQEMQGEEGISYDERE